MASRPGGVTAAAPAVCASFSMTAWHPRFRRGWADDRPYKSRRARLARRTLPAPEPRSSRSRWLLDKVCMMAPTASKPTRGTAAGRVVTRCDRWATCDQVRLLGWTAIDPCVGCVAAPVADGLTTSVVTDRKNQSAGDAQYVMGDELERLLSQVSDGSGSANSS
jgi:hypothetical protein